MYLSRRAAIALVLLAGLALACGPGSQEVNVKRVVLVTLDTTRADHLSAYGYDIQTSPWFDRMAAEGVLFERAYAQSATTKPSHASLFTSLYPIQHGVQSNALMLEERFVTWAEVLADAGYQTAAFTSVAAPLGGNVAQGFQQHDEPGEEYSRAEGNGSVYRPASATVDAAIDWLGREAEPDAPMFLWVHVYDAHKPLLPPQPYRERIDEMVAARGVDAHRAHLASQGIPRGGGLYAQGLEYDAEILYADTELQRLFDFMAAEGLQEDTVWIIAGDHGQGLGSHDHFGHSVQIYNAQLHVPLVFWSSAGVLGPRRVDDAIVELTDVLPTVMDMLRLGQLQQVMPVQGATLWPYLRGGAPQQRRLLAYSERSRYGADRAHRLEKSNYEPGSRYSYQDLDYKYLLFTEGPDEFYDLRADPYELVDLIDSEDHAEMRDLFRDRLAEAVANTESGASPGSVSQEAIEQLRALGYIQ